MTARKKCIDLAKLIAKKRDGYACQRCNRKSGEVQIQGAHILPVSSGGFLAADPRNIFALCASCHIWAGDSWHEDPLTTAHWFDSKWPGRYDELKALQMEERRLHPTIKKWQWEELLVELKLQYENM